jgi:hypothetical protein
LVDRGDELIREADLLGQTVPAVLLLAVFCRERIIC